MNYDLAIIGGGPGGYTAAAAAARAGLSVILFEKDQLGGTCLNRGCIPTKALLHAADIWRALHDAEPLGLHAGGAAFDWAAVQRYRLQTVDTLRQGVARLMEAGKVHVVQGRAQVVAEGVVVCGGTRYEAANIIVAAGALPALPPIPGRELPGVYTSNDLLEGSGKAIPSLVIIGGGVIGVEMASVYSAFGCRVTILELADRLLPTMDRDLGQRLAAAFKKQGIAVTTKAAVRQISQMADGLAVQYADSRGNPAEVSAAGVLIATGRRPTAEEVFPGAYRPAIERGGILADEAGRTTLPHLYAIGDVKAGNVQLAHVAEAQGKNAVAAILGRPLPVDTSLVPACVYTTPEIATVGMTETEAKAAGLSVRCGKALSGANGRCVIAGCRSGYIKLVCAADSGRLLGAQLCWPRATDLIGELALAVQRGLSAADLAALIHPHPTFAEGILAATEQLTI